MQMQTYSQRSKSDPNKNDVWDVSVLTNLSKDLPVEEWGIPESFLTSWSWGSDHLSEHLRGCLDADLTSPILIWEDRVVDGCHRICKALSQGDVSIKAVDISSVMPPPDTEEEAFFSEESRWCFGDMVLVLKSLKSIDYDFRHPLDI
jgi:hypothetical protein